MRIVTLDVESYYDRKIGYCLKNKNSGLTTEDYIADPRFQEILISAQIDAGDTEWFSGTHEETDEWLHSLDIPSAALCCQNTRFDGSILAMKHGIFPKFYLDTLAMATPFFKPILKSLSLGSLVEYLGIGTKGDEVIRAEGKRREDFSDYELQAYAEYCMNDTRLTYKLYKHLVKLYPASALKDELRAIDTTLRMYTQPQLNLDAATYTRGLKIAQDRKAQILVEMELKGITKKALNSNQQFAQILRDRGVDPPMKESKASQKRGDDPVILTYAFGKNDPEFIELREQFQDDLEMSTLFDARTETKSTQEETRCLKFIGKATRHKVFRVAAGYYGAHTGRYIGTDGENALNFPNPDAVTNEQGKIIRHASILREGIVAPEGHVILCADLAQIEARIAAALAGQQDLLDEFAGGGDPYSTFATDMFRREVTKELAKKDPEIFIMRKCGKETILGGWFGMGGKTFKRNVRPKGLNLTDEQSSEYINFFRNRYECAKPLWGAFDDALYSLVFRKTESQVGPLRFVWKNSTDAAMVLPNGMSVLYPNMTSKKDKEGRPKIIYQNARDKFPKNLWGGVVTENAAQSLARIIIFNHMLDIQKELGYRAALQVYDSVVLSVPEDDLDRVMKGVTQVMSRGVDWLPGLPVDVEIKTGKHYGEV